MRADVDTVLQNLLEALQQQCATSADGTGRARWMGPPEWNGDTADLEGIRDSFSREAANTAYTEVLTVHADGKMSECAARQLELAYLGAMERSFRMRHLSQSRAFAHAAAVRKAHGHAKGVHIGGVLQHIQNMLGAV